MDLMIDLETLSTSNNAAILTMAAIKFDPYADYLKGDFPSGDVTETHFLDAELQWWWKSHVSIMAGVNWVSDTKKEQSEISSFKLSAN